ncbi:MAG: restriction endonuclease subunit S, partial [Planctomycetota bacterium]|nr:restriction endonuclease subunit S [Planctomycetota bacterium]
MTPKTFLDNLRHVVDAPEGVQRLREMVLNLGVTGRLSKPRDGDTPGLICLQRCRRHYDNLVANGMMRSQPSPMDDGGSGSFGVIPPTWIWCTLGDVTSYGFTQKAEFSDVEPTTWVLELEDIEKGTSKIETKVRASERRFRSTKNRFARGQVLYGKLRPYLDKVVVADEAGVCTTEIMPILAFDGVEPEYLKVFLKSPTFRSYATNSTHGMNLPRLGTEAARAARFPLPPLEEQKRIVAKVDELMRLCDRLEAQQQERETLLPLLSRANHARFVTEPEKVNLRAIFHAPGAVSPDDLRSTICSLAVSGRLVSRQSEEDVAQALSKYNIAPILPIDAPSLPEHWKWVRLGDVATTMNSGWSPACQPKPANPDQWGVLTTTAVQALEYLENENKVLPLNLKPRPEAEVQHGDILLTRAGPKNRVGIICVARPTR